MFDLTDIVNFADDNFCVESDKVLSVLISNLEMRLEMITKWLKDSGLVVNESKTKVCLFHGNDQPLIQIRLQDVLITSKKSMNVLGVIFDSKLTWNSSSVDIVRCAYLGGSDCFQLKKPFLPYVT